MLKCGRLGPRPLQPKCSLNAILNPALDARVGLKARSDTARRRTSNRRTYERHRTATDGDVRRRPLSYGTARCRTAVRQFDAQLCGNKRQIPCIGMLMICKYSSKMAEDGVAYKLYKVCSCSCTVPSIRF